MSIRTDLRNADLSTLADLLQNQHARKVDLVAHAQRLAFENGNVVISGSDPVLTDDGVLSADGVYVPTRVADESLADKFDVPVKYLRRLREQHLPLFDANLNGLLRGSLAGVQAEMKADKRTFLVRAFRSDDGPGVLRALLSDRYGVTDNLDALMASLDGVQAAGVHVEIEGCDLSERRMSVRVVCPEISALAPILTKGYRSPFDGTRGEDLPVVWSGFQISNSETGGGAYSLTPRISLRVCKNGMTMTKDVVRAVHLGGRLDEGMIQWSGSTQQKALDLIKAKTTDAVRTFLSKDYLTAAVAALEAGADEEIGTVDAVRDVTKPLALSKEQIDGVLAHFVKGGQMTVGGVANAITSYAQEIADPDDALVVEQQATRLLLGA